MFALRLAGLAFVVVGLSGCFVSADNGGSSGFSAHKSFDKHFVGRIETVHIADIAGFVHVDTWNKPGVHVSAVLSTSSADELSNLNIIASQNGDTLTVKTDRPWSGFMGNQNGRVDYTVHVPATTAVRIEAVSGAVTIRNVRANLRVRNVSGDVTIVGAASDLQVNTVSGDIDASLAKLAGPQVVSLHVVSGSTSLHVPANASADVSASSTSGDFKSPLKIQVADQTVGMSAHGTIGTGEHARVTLGSVSGSIRVDSKT